jgi:hypothetical protein
MSERRPPRLPAPDSSSRVTANGRQERGRPTLHQTAGSKEDLTQWEVTVTPLLATSIDGHDVNAVARTDGEPAPVRPRAIFEVRAAFYGRGQVFQTPDGQRFGGVPGTRRVEETHTADADLAHAIARATIAALRVGGRDLDFLRLAGEVERGRA